MIDWLLLHCYKASRGIARTFGERTREPGFGSPKGECSQVCLFQTALGSLLDISGSFSLESIDRG